MTKPKRTSKVQAKANKIHNAAEIKSFEASVFPQMRNSLADALGLSPYGSPGSTGVQLSQTDTLFKNLRGYMISNNRNLLSQMYVELGLVQTIVDVPVDDAFRGGIELQTKQLDEEDLADLIAGMEQEDDITTYAQANKWNRLFGGGACIILTEQDPATPLNMNAIGPGTRLEFKDADMWELYPSRYSEDRGLTTEDSGPRLEFGDYFLYYGQRVHASRVILLKGLKAPSFVRPRLRGWGFSVAEMLVRSINQYLKGTDLGFEVLDEFKLDIYRVKNLVQTLMLPDGTEQVQKRIQLMNMTKNYQNAIVLDSEDAYEQKQLTWAGLADAMGGIRIQVAADMRMPLTKLFGISAAGFNSGEDDIEVYNAMVESTIRNKCKRGLLTMVQLRCKQKYGMIPDDLVMNFKPLRVMSSEQEENVKTQRFNRVLAAKTAGEITSEEFRDGVNRDHLLPIQLDTSDAALSEIESDEAGDIETEGGEGETKVKKIGDTKKSKLAAKDAPEPKS